MKTILDANRRKVQAQELTCKECGKPYGRKTPEGFTQFYGTVEPYCTCPEWWCIKCGETSTPKIEETTTYHWNTNVPVRTKITKTCQKCGHKESHVDKISSGGRTF